MLHHLPYDSFFFWLNILLYHLVNIIVIVDFLVLMYDLGRIIQAHRHI